MIGKLFLMDISHISPSQAEDKPFGKIYHHKVSKVLMLPPEMNGR